MKYLLSFIILITFISCTEELPQINSINDSFEGTNNSGINVDEELINESSIGLEGVNVIIDETLDLSEISVIIEESENDLATSSSEGSGAACMGSNTVKVRGNNIVFESYEDVESYVVENLDLIEEKLLFKIEEMLEEDYLTYIYNYSKTVLENDSLSEWDLSKITISDVDCNVRCFRTLDGCEYLKMGYSAEDFPGYLTTDHLHRYYVQILSEPYDEETDYVCNNPRENDIYRINVISYVVDEEGNLIPQIPVENAPCYESGIKEIIIKPLRNKLQVLIDDYGNMYAQGPYSLGSLY